MLLVRLARPLPGPVPPELDDELSHRHLDLLINGLREPGGRRASVPGPRLERADLHALGGSGPELDPPAEEPPRG